MKQYLDILDRILKEGVKKEMIRKAEVLDYVKSHNFEVLIVLGAGDLDNEVPQITKILQSR
jgi:UDP-N-acetylmuramate--alanine ligase